MRWWMVLIVGLVSVGSAQETPASVVGGLRVAGEAMHGLPIVVGGSRISVDFDDLASQRTDYRLRIRHCNKDGVVTDNVFVNDPVHMTMLEPISAQPAPVGVQGYRWTYQVSFPGPKGIERIPVSGYYRGWIVEAETDREVASFDFVCAEQRVGDEVRVRQRRVPSMIAPYDEGILVRTTINVANTPAGDESLQPLLIQAVDVVKNREWTRRTRIETYDHDPNTWIEGAGTDAVTYVAGAILPGNEYRQLDVRNADLYPRGQTLRSRTGADVSRFFFPGRPDNNGSPIYATGITADYEQTEFQLLWDGGEAAEQSPTIHLVGEFNAWTVHPAWRLNYLPDQGRYTLRRPLRRGRHDYQYVFGSDDWTKLEGNGWSTRSVYTVLVIYRDQRYGGFDRIIHVAQVESTGKEIQRDSK